MTDPTATIAESLNRFTGPDLTKTLAQIELSARGVKLDDCRTLLDRARASHDALATASELKRIAGQVNVTIHALGILLCLPYVLEGNETVEYVSLGAGNTGRRFDLETNLRVAEFKFIRWRGGPESIRQNTTFEDYYELASYPTPKRRYLYLLGTAHALKFFHGRRTMKSVLSRNERIRRNYFDHFGERYRTVGEYFGEHGDVVEIVDVSPWLPELVVD